MRLFLYQQVLAQRLSWIDSIGRPQRMRWLPVVLAQSPYSTGMRFPEVLQMRVEEVDFECRTGIVSRCKGGMDSAVILPAKPGKKQRTAAASWRI